MAPARTGDCLGVRAAMRHTRHQVLNQARAESPAVPTGPRPPGQAHAAPVPGQGTAPPVPLVGDGILVACADGTERPYLSLDAAASTAALGQVLARVGEFLPWYSSVHRGRGSADSLREPIPRGLLPGPAHGRLPPLRQPPGPDGPAAFPQRPVLARLAAAGHDQASADRAGRTGYRVHRGINDHQHGAEWPRPPQAKVDQADM